MKLTGKAKEEFEKWLATDHSYLITLDGYFPDQSIKDYIFEFYNSHPSMQYGVYEDWFYSVGIEIGDIFEGELFQLYTANQDSSDYRPEARTAAVERACEIFNSRNR